MIGQVLLAALKFVFGMIADLLLFLGIPALVQQLLRLLGRLIYPFVPGHNDPNDDELVMAGAFALIVGLVIAIFAFIISYALTHPK